MFYYENPIPLLDLIEKWGKTDRQLITWIATGQMEAFCWYNGLIMPAHDTIRICMRPEKHNNWVIPNQDDIAALQGKRKITVNSFIILGNPQKHSFSAELTHDQYATRSGFKISIDALVIMEPEVKRLETRLNLKKETPISSPTVMQDTPQEKPLQTMKEIADYLDCSVGTVKNYRKRKGFPYSKQGGIIISYPSKLAKWRKNNKK